jgi:hypothetical protein
VATLTTCPRCAGELQAVATAEATVGFRLFEVVDPPAVLPIAVEMVLPIPADRLDET